MALIIRKVKNLTPLPMTLSHRDVILAPNVTVDLYTILTDDRLLQIQSELQGLADRGSIEIVDTDDSAELTAGASGGEGAGGGGGGVTFPLLADDGINSAPSYSFTNATGTGVFLSAPNTLGLSANDSTVLTISGTEITALKSIVGDISNQAIPAFQVGAGTGISSGVVDFGVNILQNGLGIASFNGQDFDLSSGDMHIWLTDLGIGDQNPANLGAGIFGSSYTFLGIAADGEEPARFTGAGLTINDGKIVNLNTAGSAYLWYDGGNSKLELNSAQDLDLLVNNGTTIFHGTISNARFQGVDVQIDSDKKLLSRNGEAFISFDTAAGGWMFQTHVDQHCYLASPKEFAINANTTGDFYPSITLNENANDSININLNVLDETNYIFIHWDDESFPNAEKRMMLLRGGYDHQIGFSLKDNGVSNTNSIFYGTEIPMHIGIKANNLFATPVTTALIIDTTSVTVANGIQMLAPDGSESAPSYSFTNATNVGISYWGDGYLTFFTEGEGKTSVVPAAIADGMGRTGTNGALLFEADVDIIMGPSGRVQVQPGTASIPGIMFSDTGRGLFSPTNNQISVATNSNEVARFDNSAAAGETRFMLWDVTAGTLKRVKVGAIDSGGTGLRALAVDN